MTFRRMLLSVCAGILGALAFTVSALAAVAPTIEESYVTGVASTSVTLHAKVNPQGAETSYVFEYAPAAGTFTPVPAGAGTLSEEVVGMPVQVHLDGLAPNTSYEFRLVAGNSMETVAGEPISFAMQHAGGEFALPDGRQYEMVSPPRKEGAYIEPITELGLIKAAAAGNAITYHSVTPTEAEPRGIAETAQNLATRDSAGWQSRDLSVPHGGETGTPGNQSGGEYHFFNEDLSSSVVQPLGPFTPCQNAVGLFQPCLSPEASEQTAFLHTDYLNGNVNEPCLASSMSCDRPLVSGCPASGACPRIVEEHANVPSGTTFGVVQEGFEEVGCTTGFACGPWFVAATSDLRHVVLESDTSLTPGSPSPAGLYEWSAGKLSFIGTAREGEGAYAAYGYHGMSSDGSRVIFGGKATGPKGEQLEGLLMRDTASDETVKVGEGGFDGASADDSRVFSGAGEELYVFEVTPGRKPLTGTLTNLTQGAGLLGHVVGSSEDGSYVYFVSPGVLAGSGATSTGNNLYVDHFDGSAWRPTFIAALSSEDRYDWQGEFSNQQARVSPNGLWLALTSAARLTGYDNRDAASGRPAGEVYLYHAGTGAMVCASCDPTGARPIGMEYIELARGLAGGPRDTWPGEGLLAANLPGWDQISAANTSTEGYQSRYLSDRGRLFFDSGDALVPQDVDGTEDVYQYEPEGEAEGEHACSSSSTSGSEVFKSEHVFEVESHRGEEGAGCVALISSGNSSGESAFLDASESGGDVFFLTSAQLEPQDQDAALDIYDAHECTSVSPCISSPVSPPPCNTEASCKAPPTPQPSIYGLPSSATFFGAGNLAPTPSKPSTKVTKKTVKCRAGFVKNKKGKCVKSKKKKKSKKVDHGKVKKASHIKKESHDKGSR